jgi:four helix bundle protein
MEIGDMVYFMVRAWGVYAKKSLGDQFTRATDSIALNIAAGHGRFHFKENKNYCWYACVSIFETKTANEMALNRKLISREEYNNLLAKLKECHVRLYACIKSIGIKSCQNLSHSLGNIDSRLMTNNKKQITKNK